MSKVDAKLGLDVEMSTQSQYEKAQQEIAEHRQADETPREIYQTLSLHVENLPLAVIEWDSELRVRSWSKRAEEIFGWKGEEVVGKRSGDWHHVYDEDAAQVNQFLDEILKGQITRHVSENRNYTKTGKVICCEWYNSALLDDAGKLISVCSLVHDITERKRAERERERLFKEVTMGRERLQALSHRLVEIQEIERRHIARELHDQIGQLLTALKLILEMELPSTSLKTTRNLDESVKLVNELMLRVRDLSLDLRPSILDDLGLLHALLWYFERYLAQTQIRVNFKHVGLGERFDPDIETAAYRILQEALANVARHAHVTEVSVRIWVDEDLLILQVIDEGVGFEAEAMEETGISSGLTGIRERAFLLGGRITIDATPGKGTCLIAELPLKT